MTKAFATLRACLLALLALAAAGLAQAHPMPESQVWVDTQDGGVQLTLDLPLNRLEFAFGQDLAGAPAQVLPRHADALSRYLLQHVSIRSAGGRWEASAPVLAVRGSDGSAELEAVLHLRAPAGETPRRFTLVLDAVTHEVKTHRVQVLLRSDWAAGRVTDAPLPLGTLDAQHFELPVDLPAGPATGGFMPLLEEGALHIFEGTDHLVFLLLLLTVAPLVVAGGRWTVVRGERRAVLRQVLWVVTAFTLGHSVTLVLGSTGVLSPPVALVEQAVAVTIGVAALHAWRPLWRGGERWMALVFGLVHGLAFSASLSGAGLSAGRHALALLAFNLGIEAAQLLLVLLAMPALVAVARRSAALYVALRRVIATGSFIMASLWLLDRADVGLPFRASLLEPGPLAPLVFVGLLWALVAVGWLHARAGTSVNKKV